MSVRPLPEELQEKAITELNEVPKRVQEDIKHIQEWISKQPHLRIRNDNQWILSFLRACKFSLERTKEKLEFYSTARSLSPDLFYNINLPTAAIYACFDKGMAAVLPNTDFLSPCRCFVRFGKGDPQTLPIKTLINVALMLCDILYHNDDQCIINGQEGIVDFEGVNYAYAAQLTPTIMKQIVAIIQKAYPSRLKGIHVLNLPPLLQVTCNLGLSFLPQKLRERVHFYSRDSIEELYERIPRSVLPEEYDGSAGPFKELSDKGREVLFNKRDWLLENSKYYSDVAKAGPEKTKQCLEFFGVEGTFRKLDID